MAKEINPEAERVLAAYARYEALLEAASQLRNLKEGELSASPRAFLMLENLAAAVERVEEVEQNGGAEA